MKKSYIVLTFIAVFGAGAIALFPSKDETAAQSSSVEANTTTTTTSNTSNAKSTTTSQQTSTSSSNTTYTDGTYKGSTESTPFGDIQISIVVSGGSITDVTFLQIPEDDNHSAQLSRQASTRLESQTITAQSADISGMSGATYTSEAYINSLQAAIDAAKGA